MKAKKEKEIQDRGICCRGHYRVCALCFSYRRSTISVEYCSKVPPWGLWFPCSFSFQKSQIERRIEHGYRKPRERDTSSLQRELWEFGSGGVFITEYSEFGVVVWWWRDDTAKKAAFLSTRRRLGSIAFQPSTFTFMTHLLTSQILHI